MLPAAHGRAASPPENRARPCTGMGSRATAASSVPDPGAMTTDLRSLLHLQNGVVSRRQVRICGFTDNDIERWLRRRDLCRVHEGGYVDHTGTPTWLQRAWAAVLFCWPAALSHDSAVWATWRERPRAPRMPTDTLHVAVDHTRRCTAPQAVVLHRVRDLDPRVLWNLGPPRVRIDDAVLDAAALRSRPLDALGVVTDACGAQVTTPARLRTALAGRARLRHGVFLRTVLDDLDEGVRSVLEHAYLTRVERAHGLPRARRQLRAPGAAGRVAYRDVAHAAHRVAVELDGRAGHELSQQRWADLERDLVAQLDGWTTVRLSWAQVVGSPCRTADAVARLLQQRGWTGRPRPCGPSCTLWGGLPAPGAAKPPHSARPRPRLTGW